MSQYVQLFKIKQNQYYTQGVPLHPSVINEILWCLNLTISDKILKLWITKIKEGLVTEGLIQINELMFLLLNCYQRDRIIALQGEARGGKEENQNII